MNKQTHSTNHVGSLPEEAFELGSRAMDAMSDTADSLKKAANGGEKIVKQYPMASAGAILGAGFLLGALAHKMFGHTPTLIETLGIDELPNRARRSIKNWL